MRRAVLLAVVAATCAAGPAPTPAEIVAQADKVPSPWPGFEPASIPVALDDGTRTWLVGHPHPPATPPRLHANNAVDIDGVQTAGIMLGGRRAGLPALAALVTHERFHVFEKAHHADWSANEADLFAWPVDDARVAALADLELGLLARAAGEACAARAALVLRAERHHLLPPPLVEYERHAELWEGLAQHVARAAAPPLIPAHFAPDKVRDRFYASGDLLAVALDAHAPGWPARLEAKTQPLDELLGAALGEGPSCAPSAATRAAAEARARRETGGVAARLAADLRRFKAQPGASLRVIAKAPLFPQGFDPLNVSRVGPREVLHRRYLKLGNDAGTIEVEGVSLTTAVGPHPLMNGVVELLVTGLAAPPAVRPAGDDLDLEAPGVKAHFARAMARTVGRETIVELIPGGKAR